MSAKIFCSFCLLCLVITVVYADLSRDIQDDVQKKINDAANSANNFARNLNESLHNASINQPAGAVKVACTSDSTSTSCVKTASNVPPGASPSTVVVTNNRNDAAGLYTSLSLVLLALCTAILH